MTQLRKRSLPPTPSQIIVSCTVVYVAFYFSDNEVAFSTDTAHAPGSSEQTTVGDNWLSKEDDDLKTATDSAYRAQEESHFDDDIQKAIALSLRGT